MNQVDGISQKLGTVFESAKQEMADIVGSEVGAKPNTMPDDLDKDIDELSPFDEQAATPAPEQTTAVTVISDSESSVAIQNQNYIEEKLRQSTSSNQHILDLLNTDITNNSVPPNMKLRAYEVHANITNSIALLMREMRELSKMRLGIDMIANEQLMRSKAKENKDDRNDDGTISLTSQQLLKIVQEARKQPLMDAEDINFTIVEASKP